MRNFMLVLFTLLCFEVSGCSSTCTATLPQLQPDKVSTVAPISSLQYIETVKADLEVARIRLEITKCEMLRIALVTLDPHTAMKVRDTIDILDGRAKVSTIDPGFAPPAPHMTPNNPQMLPLPQAAPNR